MKNLLSKPILGIAAIATLSSCISPVAKQAKETAVTTEKPKTVSAFFSQSAANSSAKSGFKLRPFEEKTLENGLKVLFVEDNSLPYISYGLLIRTGAGSDPFEFSGLSSFVAELLDKGSAQHTAPQIADALGKLGADFDASVSPDYTYLSTSSLSQDAHTLLDLYSEIILQPSFSEGEVNRVRKLILASIQKKVDNADAFADQVWNDFLFQNHPYSRPIYGDLRSVDSIRKKNLILHYKKYYRPSNAILAVVGRVTPELMRKVETTFGAWEDRATPELVFPPVLPAHGLQIRLVDKPDLVQAQIRVGHIGIKRKNDDYVQLRVATTILGGAFASRLVDRVRKELGLTYSISSIFDARLDHGPFEISTFTKSTSIGQTVSETLQVLSKFRKGGVTEAEVEMAKGYLRGMFPVAIETPEKLTFNLLLLRLYGIPDTYLTTYLQEIDRTTVADVNRVIKKYMDDSNLKVLVYGNAAEALPQLQPLGLVEVKKASEMQQ